MRVIAIYHLHVGIVSRSSGRSSVAAAAYRAAEKLRSERDSLTHDYAPKSSSVNAAAYRSGESLTNEQEGIEHDYTHKRGVVHTEILLPANAPQEYHDRATLWNAVEKSEKRKDAQTARDIDMALPVEFNRQEQIGLVREYVKENFARKGMCADFAIHDKEDGNPHAHVLLTTREVTEKGFGKKNRDWNGTAQLKSWRESWAVACNEHLRVHGERIDHRTLKAQGIDREPTIHIGVAAKHMERRGNEHDRAKQNREIVARNESKQHRHTAEHMHQTREGYISLDKDISSLQQTVSEAGREMNSYRVKAEEIQERAEHIQAMQGRLEELRAKRQGMGVFESKRDIDNQIQQHERTHEQATAYFKRMYRIEPEQATAEVTRLEAAAQSKRNLQDRLHEKLRPMSEEQEVLRLEYQRVKLLADISPDRQKTYDRLTELGKESQSTRDNLARLRCQRTLDTITEQDFHRIIRNVPHDKVQALIELREREREQERLRAFQRSK